MSARRIRTNGISVAVTLCVAAAGTALVASALAGPTEDRAKLVAVESAGISVPVRTTELVDVGRATPVRAFDDTRTVFAAPGLGEFDGFNCIFVAGASGGTDVVPIACDTPERAASKGLDLGESTPDGGIAGVVARLTPDGTTVADGYRVGPRGGTVQVDPGFGDPVTLRFPDLVALDARASEDAAEYAKAHPPVRP